MKQPIKGLFAFTVLSTLASCGFNTNSNRQYNEKTGASSDDYSYLSDSNDAAASSDSNADTTPVDSTVAEDIAPKRLDAMVAKLLESLDADKDSKLSLEEFLKGPAFVCDKVPGSLYLKLTDDKKEKLKTDLTQKFEKYAGDDKLLSADELKTFLVSQAPRVAHHRHKQGMGPGSMPPRPEGGRGVGPQAGERRDLKQAIVESDVFQKFDKDGDGKLSSVEFQAFIESVRQRKKI